MKKLLGALFFIAMFGNHKASGKVHRIDAWNVDKYERYSSDIASRMEQNCLPDGEDIQEHIKKVVWSEVQKGERNLLLLVSNDEAKEYRAHLYYTVEPKHDRIRIAAPGFYQNDANIMIPVLATFFKCLRTMFPTITFTLPQNRIPAYERLIKFFGFVPNDDIVTEEYVKKAEELYEYKEEVHGKLHGFVLPADVEIKGKDMCVGVPAAQ